MLFDLSLQNSYEESLHQDLFQLALSIFLCSLWFNIVICFSLFFWFSSHTLAWPCVYSSDCALYLSLISQWCLARFNETCVTVSSMYIFPTSKSIYRLNIYIQLLQDALYNGINIFVMHKINYLHKIVNWTLNLLPKV